MTASCTPTPVGGVTCIWNVTVTVGVDVVGTDGVMMIVVDAVATIVTDVEVTVLLPAASVSVADTRYVPLAL